MSFYQSANSFLHNRSLSLWSKLCGPDSSAVAMAYSDPPSDVLARRALFVTLSLALAGAGLGSLAAGLGMLTGKEATLVLSCILFCVSTLITLVKAPNSRLQKIAVMSTIFFALYLSAGVILAAFGTGRPLGLFAYLLWFFPLLMFNRIVNKPSTGRLLGIFFLIAPGLLLLCLLPKLLGFLNMEELILMAVYCLSYFCFGVALSSVSRYRDKYIVERETAKSLSIEAAILESLSDCFISLDSDFRLVYVNEAASDELFLRRPNVLKNTLAVAAPGFLSDAVLEELRVSSARPFASFFEVLSESGRWYDLRCFPRSDGVSIYFRDISKAMASRQVLDAAHSRLLDQAALLDNAQDAISVVGLDGRLQYWNAGAERIYGWKSEEVVGTLAHEVFQYDQADMNKRISLVINDGTWTGEVSQLRHDGSSLVVESRCTLVRAENGTPKAILAINTDITSRKAAENRIENLAFYDSLTELPNRQLLQERLCKALEPVAGEAAKGAVLYIDIDDFKTVNDTMGHEAGDALLQQVASRLGSCINTENGDTLGRTGGDEFLVVLNGLSNKPEEAMSSTSATAQKMLDSFREPFILGDHRCETSASIGATLLFGESDTLHDLMKRSDLAMYQAKAEGGGTLRFFDPEMQTKVDDRAALLADLRRALQNDEFELHYQPQVDSEGMVFGWEALLRWFHPVRGRVAPDQFIPLAEDAGLIVELGRWVLKTACQQLAVWSTHPAMAAHMMAVNISVCQLSDPEFASLVSETLKSSGANPYRLKLEITESSVMDKVDEISCIMTGLKKEGVSFSLDDFGTGYSSLSYLSRLPLDQLKIDRSFVNNILTNSKDASLARTIITLGRTLGLSVIAEGVETEAQRNFLRSEGCNLYQGFLYSPAVSVSRCEAFVNDSIPEFAGHASPGR